MRIVAGLYGLHYILLVAWSTRRSQEAREEAVVGFRFRTRW